VGWKGCQFRTITLMKETKMKKILLTTLIAFSTAAGATGLPVGSFANAVICNSIQTNASVNGAGSAVSGAAATGFAQANATAAPGSIAGTAITASTVDAGSATTGSGQASQLAMSSTQATASSGYKTPVVGQSGFTSSTSHAFVTNGTATAVTENSYQANATVTPTGVTVQDTKLGQTFVTGTGNSVAFSYGNTAVASVAALKVGVSVPTVGCMATVHGGSCQ